MDAQYWTLCYVMCLSYSKLYSIFFLTTLLCYAFLGKERVRIQRHRMKLELIRLKCSIVNDFHKEFTHMRALNTSTWNGFQFVSIEICIIENPFGVMCVQPQQKRNWTLARSGFNLLIETIFNSRKWECEFDSLVLHTLAVVASFFIKNLVLTMD